MLYDYSRLKRRIEIKCGNKSNFAKLIGMPEHLLSHKMNGRTAFTQRDIEAASNALQISAKDIPAYFFTFNVQNIEH